MRAFIVDDELDVREHLGKLMHGAGYEVSETGDASEAESGIQAFNPDIVLLDVNMPGMNGFEICRNLRHNEATAHVPVIFITARTNEVDRIYGLDSGADDYIMKPFNDGELLARARAVLRRFTTSPNMIPVNNVRQFGDWQLNYNQMTSSWQQRHLPLTPKEFRLLDAFVSQPGKILQREKLCELLWGDDSFFDIRQLDTHIANLRAKLKHFLDYSDAITSIRGIGYIWNEKIR